MDLSHYFNTLTIHMFLVPIVIYNHHNIQMGLFPQFVSVASRLYLHHLYRMYTPSTLKAVPEQATHVRDGIMNFPSLWDTVTRPSGEQLMVSGKIRPRLPHYCQVMTLVNHQPIRYVSSRLTCKTCVPTVGMTLNQ